MKYIITKNSMKKKIILTENQFKRLINEENIFTDEEEYNKAMSRYEKQNMFYNFFNSFRKYENKKISYLTLGTSFYENPTIKKWKNVSKTDDILLSLEFCKEKISPKEECKLLYKSMGFPKIVGWFKIMLDNNEKYLKMAGESYIIKLRTPFSESNNPGLSGYIKDKGYFYMPILKTPVKPILKKLSPSVTPKTTPTVSTTQKPNNNGTSVFGPSNSLIGFINNRKFIPYDKQETMIKSDRDLLNNKIELEKYLRGKFGDYLIF